MPLRVSSTRSLGAYTNIFANESFIDELAHSAGEYRLRFLNDERARDVLTKCAEKFGGSSFEKKKNRGHGIAFGRYKNFAALVAVAIEGEVSPRNGRVHVVRAVAANDSGPMISPDGIANQVEGGFIQSLSRALKEEVKFDATGVLSNDWKRYPNITFSGVPHVDVVLIDRPGEPSLDTGDAAQGPTRASDGRIESKKDFQAGLDVIQEGMEVICHAASFTESGSCALREVCMFSPGI